MRHSHRVTLFCSCWVDYHTKQLTMNLHTIQFRIHLYTLEISIFLPSRSFSVLSMYYKFHRQLFTMKISKKQCWLQKRRTLFMYLIFKITKMSIKLSTRGCCHLENIFSPLIHKKYSIKWDISLLQCGVFDDTLDLCLCILQFHTLSNNITGK